MKHKIQIFATAAMVASLWLAAPGTLKAQIPLEFSISGTMLTQGNTIDDGSVTKAPTQSSITTASLLKQLALDEEAGGNWGTNKFPAGAKLIYATSIQYVGMFFQRITVLSFQVFDEHNNLLLVISTNVLSLGNIGQNSISSGIYLDGGTVQTSVQLAALTYDATSIGGTNKYTVTGLGTSTIKNTAVSQSPRTLGNYTETQTFGLQNGTGEGVNADGVNIVLTGVTITESGSVNLNNGEGVSGFTLYKLP